MNRIADELDQSVRVHRKIVNMHTSHYNLQQVPHCLIVHASLAQRLFVCLSVHLPSLQAEQRRAAERQKAEQEQALKKQEIEHLLSSDFMTEKREAFQRAGDPTRVIPYAFKGFSTQQLQQILQEQQHQAEELKV